MGVLDTVKLNPGTMFDIYLAFVLIAGGLFLPVLQLLMRAAILGTDTDSFSVSEFPVVPFFEGLYDG